VPLTVRSPSGVGRIPPVVVAGLLVSGIGRDAVAQSPSGSEPAPGSGAAIAVALPTPPVQQSNSVFRWEEHPTLHLGIVEVAFRARFRARSRQSDAPFGDEGDLATDIARKRIGVEGAVGHYAEFQVERELGDDDPWRDVYVNYSQFEEGQFQIGKFKLPFGLEENISSTNLDFAYRSLAASILSPGRDRGFMAHGWVLGRTLRYELGSFEHDGSNARPGNPDRVFGGQTVSGRISSVPFRSMSSPADDFELGVAWASSDVPEGFSGIRGQTVFGETFFSSDFYVLGRRRRQGFEIRWRPGPFSIQSEYIRVTEERLGQSVENTDLSPLRARGWYVSGTWALTGEKKADNLNAPSHPLFQGGVGAIEVAGRIEQLTFDSTAPSDGVEPSTSPRADVILGNSDRVLTLGVNWYLNRWIKVQFNVIRETIADPAQGPLPEQPTFWSRVLAAQFTL
jgi:phosphate-selective porin OprO and OprP